MTARVRLLSLSCAALVSALCAATSLAADALAPLELRQVKVGGEIGRRIEVTTYNNLLKINIDKDFLPPFQKKTAKDGYIGLGKLIDTAVRLAAYTGDEKVAAVKRHLIEETIRAQEPDGYPGMLAPGFRMSGMWDVHEVGYLIYGLTSDYRFFGDKRSLAAACKAADHVIGNWPKIPADWDRQTKVATHVSVTGLERTLLTLSGAAHEQRYLDFCVNQRALPAWDLGIVVGRRELIEGHIYAYMARCLAQLELYRQQPDQRLLRCPQRALDFLTAGEGMAITGGAGQMEIWTADQDGRGELGETCATAYLLRVYDSLLRLRGDAYYGDLMERTIYNALFAAQSPDGRQIRYFAPVEGPRKYHPTDTYCCPCNYRRIVAELPTMIYYRAGEGLLVNLYTASEARLDGPHAMRIRQETDYPNSGRVVLRIDPERLAKFPLQLRIPRWAQKVQAKVNGQAIAGEAKPGTLLTIDRKWSKGDQVLLELFLPWRLVEGRQRQAGRVAVMRGPLVYCLNPSQHPELAKVEPADLNRWTLDPTSLAGPTASAAVRPAGTACRVGVRKPGFELGKQGQIEVELTEFPDPAGQSVYFTLADPRPAVPDEVILTKK